MFSEASFVLNYFCEKNGSVKGFEFCYFKIEAREFDFYTLVDKFIFRINLIGKSIFLTYRVWKGENL